MLKTIFRLLTAVISFFAFLVLPAAANAAVTNNASIQPVQKSAIAQNNLIDLNLVTPSLLSVQSDSFPHLGCACADCLQVDSSM